MVMKTVQTVNAAHQPYAPHLLVNELSLDAGKEWTPLRSDWSLILLGSGNGYWIEEQSRRELPSGSLVLTAGNVGGRILASQLDSLELFYFTIMPQRLMGLFTHGEQDFLKDAPMRREVARQILPPTHPVAVKMKDLCHRPERDGLLFRLSLLQLFAEVFGRALDRPTALENHLDVRERLRMFLSETPPAVLLELSSEELAGIIHCTPRHLSRVFCEVVGMTFRKKRAELRLARARELLATSQSKVVDVAMKSGYKSLSLFNRMFTRRYGISPGGWRNKNEGTGSAAIRRNGHAGTGAN
jgi:AraC-like DNA-binding protein